MADTKTPLEAGYIYHIYNHAVGNEVLFKTDSNYLFFLSRLEKYLINYIDIYAYCLLPNHFHLLIKVNPTRVNNPRRVSISRQFSHMFNSYAQSFNKENFRKGSLFNNRFKRKPVKNEFYLTNLINYIHYNPVNHGLVSNISDWRFSSYNSILHKDKSIVKREFVLGLFNDIQNFKYCHEEAIISKEYERI